MSEEREYKIRDIASLLRNCAGDLQKAAKALVESKQADDSLYPPMSDMMRKWIEANKQAIQCVMDGKACIIASYELEPDRPAIEVVYTDLESGKKWSHPILKFRLDETEPS